MSALAITFIAVTYSSIKRYDSVRHNMYKKYQTLVDSYVLTKNFELSKKRADRKI